MVEFTVQKCKTRAGYSAKLVKQGQLDLAVLRKKFDVVMDTPVLLVLSIDGIEVIVHGYGELLFKKCDDVALAEKIAEKIYAIGVK
jgi:hypothetical protein